MLNVALTDSSRSAEDAQAVTRPYEHSVPLVILT